MAAKPEPGFFPADTFGKTVKGELVPTRALRKTRSCARVLGQVRAVRHFFPELDGVTIRVGLTRAADGYASIEEPAVWLNPFKLGAHTIAHELVHLLQARGHLPGGEKTADLHALGRHPALADELPGYLKAPPEMREHWDPKKHGHRLFLHETARDSLAASGGSRRRAIRLFEEALPGRWRGVEAVRRPAAGVGPEQTALGIGTNRDV